jgi:hypothetical protein
MALNSESGMDHDARLTRIYRAAGDETPPLRLDQAICGAARREAGAGPRSLSRLRTWHVPVSLAAVMVLSLTVVLMMREEGADRLESLSVPVTPPAAVLPPPAEPAVPRSDPQPPPSQRQVQTQSAPLAETGRSSPAPLPVAKMVPQAEQNVLSAAVPPAGRTEQAASSRSEPPPASPRALMRSAPAPAPAMADAVSGPEMGSSGAVAARQAAASVQQTLWQDLVQEPPQKWVQRIVEWRRAGRTADADALMQEFRRRFPEHPLPDPQP